jgi:putative PIN family toxin of toxin-antitoxin system
MLVVIDTNIFISYLLVPASQPAKIVALWQSGKFDVLTAQPQIDELMRVTRYPKIKERISTVLAGRFVNELRDLSIIVDDLPFVDVSPDPYDNYLFSISSGGRMLSGKIELDINADSIRLIANAVIFYNATLLSELYQHYQSVDPEMAK